MKIYLNGELKEKELIKELFEPGFLFGWGVFEVLRVYNKNPFLLDEHIQRLNKNLRKIQMEEVNLNWNKIVDDLLRENNLKDAYLRITVYKKRKTCGAIIYVDEFKYYPESIYQKGFKAIVYPQKIDTKNYLFSIKSLSYLEKRVAWFLAQKEKKQEALILNKEGFLVGGSRTNIFLVKQNKIFTSSKDCGIFEGITRKAIIELIKNKLNLEVIETKLTLENLYTSREVFLTSSLVEVMPLVECENRKINDGIPGKLTQKIHSEYRLLLKNGKSASFSG
jgi:branched-chain amino acid aminotransferase